jgi:hypothetical protein
MRMRNHGKEVAKEVELGVSASQSLSLLQLHEGEVCCLPSCILSCAV